jgi:hypothetical protein
MSRRSVRLGQRHRGRTRRGLIDHVEHPIERGHDRFRFHRARVAVSGEWLTFGRLRPIHTNATLFGLASLALVGLAYYVAARSCGSQLYSARLAWIGLVLFNVAAVVGTIALDLGYDAVLDEAPTRNQRWRRFDIRRPEQRGCVRRRLDGSVTTANNGSRSTPPGETCCGGSQCTAWTSPTTFHRS